MKKNLASISSVIPWSLLAGLFLPLLIGGLGSCLFPFLSKVMIFFVWFFPLAVIVRLIHNRMEGDTGSRCGLLQYISFMPGGIAYKTDLKQQEFPVVTLSLIFLNTVLFFALPIEMVERFLFYPLGDPSYFRVIVAFFASTFLHADTSHLLWNMFFLWVYGSVVEGRIGTVRYCALYFLLIAGSHFFTIFIQVWQSLVGTETFTQLLTSRHGLGASGAISGVMGLFAIRCYFSNVTVGVPFLLLPWISFPIRMQGVVLVGLFFALDIKGSIYDAGTGNIGYWAHAGGYLSGILAACYLGLHKKAAEEAVHYKAQKLSRNYWDTNEAIERYKEIQKKETGNIQALQYLLSMSSFNMKKSAPYYSLLMQELVRSDFLKAVDLFNEHYPDHVKTLSPDILVKLGIHYARKSEHEKAMTCLEFASFEPGPWQAKSMIILADSYVAIDNFAMARKTWKMIMTRFPETHFAEEAQRKYKEAV